MEPLPGTRTVRRTVRVAVALLLGQALLCAVIGYVTYRSSPAQEERKPGVVDQMADAPRMLSKSSAASVRPSATSARVTSPPRATTRPKKRASTPRSTSPPVLFVMPSSSPSVVSSAPAPVPTFPSVPPAPPAPPSTSPVPSVGLIPPVPVQQPVTVGELCRPLGAIGRTEDGEKVRCQGSRHRRPRWKIV